MLRYTADRLRRSSLHAPSRARARHKEAIVHPNYVLVYRVADAIEILAILHARQQYP